jgi:DNA invertase Pin-like site-specific DNA recombinase
MSAIDANAVIIARVSSKRQEDEGYSLPAQKKLLKSYAADRGLNLLEAFEIAESASKAVQRKIFKEAMNFIEVNKVKHLIVEKVDRHVRNLQDAVETHDWLMADEAKCVHFVKDSLVMHKNSRSQEWLNWGIRVVMAKNYIDNLREEAMKGWAEKLAQGWLPAVPPPGYMTITENGKRIHVPNPDTKLLMQRAFQFYLEPNQSIASVADEMNRMGIRTRKGRPYYKSQVQRILTNTFYIGINSFDGQDYPGAQVPIIDKTVFDAVQRKMRRKLPYRFRQHNPVLKNLIYCNHCGGVVTWQLQKGHYYGTCQRKSTACRGRVLLREDRLEVIVMQMLKDLVSPSPEVIDWVVEAMAERHKEAIDTNDQLIRSIQTQIERLERMDTNLYDDKIAGDISPERYQTKHDELLSQKSGLEARAGNIDQELGERLQQRLVLLELSQKAAEIYPSKTPEQKRLIITKLFDKLTYDNGVVTVIYTNFARAIAQNVQLTHQLIGGTK